MMIGAMILAAGKDRLDDLPKATLELSGTSVIKREINLLREAGISIIVVVAGADSEALEKHLAHRKVSIIRNHDSEHGDMLLSVKKGLEALEGTCDQVVMVPVDAPAFLPDSIHRLVEADCTGQYDISVPTFNGKTGHPVLIQSSAVPKIMNYYGEGGLSGMLETGLLRACYVPVTDPGIFMELNNKGDSGAILEYDITMRDEVPISPVVQISLKRNKDFLNTEFVTFLRYIEKMGSMNGACQKMGIAYSRAWTMINQAENQLGYPLIQRLTGGKGGGSSVLTPQCIRTIEQFESFSSELNKEADRIFHEIFRTSSTKE